MKDLSFLFIRDKINQYGMKWQRYFEIIKIKMLSVRSVQL
jgi:hypothetical protein